MRRFFHLALGMWFVVTMTMAQACMAPLQSSSSRYPDTSLPSAVGSSGGYSSSSAGSSSSSGYSTAANPPNLSNYTPDRSESQALTEYLTQHRLPLVGAQVLKGPSGQRAVILYGFVGTNFGKSDAVAKARRYLGDPSLTVENRINVRPELLASGSGSGSATAPDSTGSSSSSYPGVQSYVDQQKREQAQIQQYQQQQALGGTVSSLAPLIMLLGMLSASMAGSSSGFSYGGTSVSPYAPYGGSVPYGPYPSYPPSYYGSPYAAPPSSGGFFTIP